jgi:putative ABC transport system substrate-binding protein
MHVDVSRCDNGQCVGAGPVIGVLYGVSAAEWADRMVAFRRGLAETAFVEGRNVAIEYRWADGHYDRFPWMAADLVSGEFWK